MASSSGGTVGTRSDTGRYLASRTLMSRSISCEAVKGGMRVSISYRHEPSENTSERWSSLRPSACSGLMYLTLPLMTPVLVCTLDRVALAMPKSHSLTSPAYEQMTFDGDTSRWTIRSGRRLPSTALWAACRAPQISAAT